MRNSKVIPALWLSMWLGTLAWGQAPPKPPVTPAASGKPSATQPAATSPKAPAPAAKTPAAATARPVKRAVGRSTAGAPRRKIAQRKRVVQRTAVTRVGSIHMSGRRDPFVSPVVERVGNAPVCAGGGKRCLIVGEISLHGVVRSPSGFIAVVMNGDHTYFLHENDPLADGAVERITRDTITLRERSSDALGRPLTREVTKKIGAPAI